nr:neural Wiskott-Aldrich syndrome protein-like [Vicugna pacos]
MSTISKRFGLKYKEESYIFKELEKVRKETKKDFHQFKQKLASKPAVGEVISGLQAWQGEKGSVSHAGPLKPPGPPRAKGPAPRAAALVQQAPRGAALPPGPSQAAAPGKTRPFRPQDFYLRSSAFRRHPPQEKPPVIASMAGTSRPVVLVPPPAPSGKARVRQGPRSPRPAGSKPVLLPAREPAPLAEARRARERKGSPLSSDDGDAEAAGLQRRVRIRTRSLREGLGVEPRGASGPVSKIDRESNAPSDAREAAPQAPQPVRAAPTSMEEIIASLQSEAQLASDQTIKELIQSVLGQNYDIKMEVGEPGEWCFPG